MLLEMRNIGKSFLGVQVLVNAGLYVEQGEVHGLTGPNGVGKSTLIKIVSGVLQQDQGNVMFDGEELQVNSPVDALKKGIFTLYQEPHLIPELSITDNVFLGMYERKLGVFAASSRMKKKTEEVLSYFDCNLKPEMKVKSLTQSEKYIVAVAKAFFKKAKLYIMDEPTASLSAKEQQIIFRLIDKLKKSGASVIYITHRLNEVSQICDKVTMMREGRCICTLDKAEMRNNSLFQSGADEAVKKYYTGQVADSHQEMLELRNLFKRNRYSDINLVLKKGEILGIAGSVGSGRTALMKTVFGAVQQDSGDIYMEGRRREGTGVRQAIERGIGYMPDDRLTSSVIPEMTAMENVMLAGKKNKKSFFIKEKSEMEHFIDSVVEPGYFLSDPGQQIKYMSGGNQQKIVFFRWLVSNSKILLLDEPTKGIDAGTRSEMYQMILEKASQGMSFLVSSSEIEELRTLCTRILVLNHGYIVDEMPVEQADSERLLKAMSN